MLDAAYRHSVDYWVAFRDLPHRQSSMWGLLKPGFQHVELWSYVPPGAWLRFDTAMEFIAVEVYADPPWSLIQASENPTFLHYQGGIAHGKLRQPWRCGPVTCVELSAAFLGIRLPFWCRTPYQLFRLLRTHGQKESTGAAD